MDRERAIALVGYLVAATTGWNDDSVLVYTAEVEKMRRADIAASAIQKLARGWSEARRPPISAVLDAYRRELSHSQPSPEITQGRILPLEEGIEVARNAYEAERRRLGLKPKFDRFDRWAATLTGGQR